MGQKMWALTRRCRKTSVVRLAESGRQRQRTPVWMHGSSLDVCSKSISVAGCLDDGKSSGRLLSLKMLEAFVQALITFYTGISVVSSEVGDSPFFILAAPYTEAHKRLPDASRVCRAMYRLLLTMHSCNSALIYILQKFTFCDSKPRIILGIPGTYAACGVAATNKAVRQTVD